MGQPIKPTRSQIMRFLRKLPKGKHRFHKKLGPFANTRLKREQFITESQRQGVEVARKRRQEYLERRQEQTNKGR